MTGLLLGQRTDHRVLQINIQSLRTGRDFRGHDNVREEIHGWLQLTYYLEFLSLNLNIAITNGQ